METNYRILNKEEKIMYTGTNTGSWFSLENAKQIVDYTKGEKIYEYNVELGRKMWEVM